MTLVSIAALVTVLAQPADVTWLSPVLEHLNAGTVDEGIDAAMARVARSPQDSASRFVVGALLTHAGRPRDASAWLAPLRPVEGADGALWVYLGVGAAAAGEASTARRYLDYASARPDAALFARYHRALLLRDEDRQQALVDARFVGDRLDGQGAWAPHASQLVAVLETCSREQVARCDGPWGRSHGPPRPFPLGIVALCAVLIGWGISAWGSSGRPPA